MGLETGSFVGDLNAANPPGTDPKSQGDDHIRLIKKALLDSFSGFTGAIVVGGVDGGAINAYTLTSATALPAMTRKMLVVFAPVANNTGASTMNISSLGVTPIVAVDGAPLAQNDLQLGYFYAAFYDGTSLRLTGVTKRYLDNLVIAANFPAPPTDGRQYVLGGQNGSASYVQTPVGATIQAYKLGAL